MPPRPRWPASSAPSPASAKNRDAHAARHPQPSPRGAWRDRRATRGSRSCPSPLDAPNCPDPGAGRGAPSMPGTWRWPSASARLSQRAGDRDRAHRHHRPGDGLRHHRHRARFRAGQIQEARRRRLFPDHQPHRAGGARDPRLRPGSRSRRSSATPSATARSRTRRRSTTRSSRPRASPTARSRRSNRRSPPPSTSRFAFNKWTLGEEFCKAAFGFTAAQIERCRLRHAGGAGLHQGRDRGGQHLLLRRHDARKARRT